MISAPVKVRIYGESFKIHATKINDKNLKDFIRASQQLKEPLEEALLNVSFFKVLNLIKYQSLEDVIDFAYGGLINNHKNSIEIWSGRRCLQKFSLNDLLSPNTLFPIFNTKRRTLTVRLDNQLFLIEKEMGLIGEYVVDCKIFDINLLKFHIDDMQYLNEALQVLTSISYDSTILNSQKSDTLIIHRHCVNHLKLN